MPFGPLLEQAIQMAESRESILTDGQFTVGYEELPGLLQSLAQDLAALGVEPEACLCVECPNTLAGALTLLSLLQQGISFVLLPPSEQADGGSLWKPVPYFCRQRLVVKRSAEDLSGGMPFRPGRFLALETNPGYQPPADPNLSGPGYLFLRTSGSMGASKLVVHTHQTLLDNAGGCVIQYAYTPADRLTIPVPIAHMYGLGVGLLPGILAGASIDLQDQTNLLRYLAHEKRFKPTVACVTPTLCAMLLKGFRSARSYRLAITATQRISEAAFRAFDAAIGGTFVNQYGSSEMGAIAVCAPTDPLALKAVTIGRPFPGVALDVQDGSPSNGADSVHSTGEGAGELFCRHPAGFVGYVDESGQWLHRQARDGWYRTGDLARQLPDGCFQITGRAGNSMNRRGYLVHFAEIERLMEQIAGLEQVVVVGKGETESITAFCVTARQMGMTNSQIREQCFHLLPNYAIPDNVLLLDQLPLLPSGKVDRQRLTALAI